MNLVIDLKNKKILLICKETFSYPMYFLGKKLEERGNEVAYFFVHSSEVVYQKNKSNKNTYFFFKDIIDNKKIFDVKDINLKFIDEYQSARPDMDYLNKIENIYGKGKNLNQQIMSSQMITTPYHNRFFWCELSYEQTLYWVELNYKKAEEVLNFFSPQIILDLDTAEIQRTILNEICSVKNIPYITIEYPRFESFIVPTFNLGLKEECFFIKKYENNLKEDLTQEIGIIERFNKQEKIMADVYKNDVTSSYDFSVNEAIKRFFNAVRIVFNVEASFGNMKIKKFKLNTPLFSNPIKAVKFFLLLEIRRLKLYAKSNKYFVDPANEDYVYMPLHLIPESTTFVKSPLYIDELSIIHAVSKSLPIGWKLYVKEHQAMIGERPIKFYKEIKKLYNVKVVKLNYYKDPKPWIEKSKGVITISGTTAFEARLLNRPSAIFGHVCFNVIDGIEKINSILDLKEIFIKFKNYKQKETDIKSIASYLRTIKDLGVELDIKKLLKLSEECIVKKDLDNKELNKLNDTLVGFFDKSYASYNEYHVSGKIKKV